MVTHCWPHNHAKSAPTSHPVPPSPASLTPRGSFFLRSPSKFCQFQADRVKRPASSFHSQRVDGRHPCPGFEKSPVLLHSSPAISGASLPRRRPVRSKCPTHPPPTGHRRHQVPHRPREAGGHHSTTHLPVHDLSFRVPHHISRGKDARRLSHNPARTSRRRRQHQKT